MTHKQKLPFKVSVNVLLRSNLGKTIYDFHELGRDRIVLFLTEFVNEFVL